jgi:hypothetical protein
MIITESLAKGLKNRFFLEIDDELVRRLEQAAKPGIRGKISPAGWLRFIDKYKKIFGRCVFCFYEGGSKGNPYFAFVSLWVNKKRQFNQWDEKCLTGKMVIVNTDPTVFKDMDALFNVGEHAIARIYERGVVKVDKNLNIDIFSILPEFNYVPIWSAFWSFMFDIFKRYYYSNINYLIQIYPVIPTKNGLFFGQISHKDCSPLEIRTFVNDKNLTVEQQQAKQILLNVSSGMESSPLCFFPIGGDFEGEGEGILIPIICLQMLKNYDAISSIIFYRIDDDQLRYQLKDKFKKVLIDQSNLVSQELIDLFKKIGVRAFLIEIKKSLLKARMKSKGAR